MEESRIKRIEALAKKIAKIEEELDLLIDAMAYQVAKTRQGDGVVVQLKQAKDNLLKAIYSLALAEASADGDQYIDRMQVAIDQLGEAQ